jgi:hypothetical protein
LIRWRWGYEEKEEKVRIVRNRKARRCGVVNSMREGSRRHERWKRECMHNVSYKRIAWIGVIRTYGYRASACAKSRKFFVASSSPAVSFLAAESHLCGRLLTFSYE